MGVAIAVSRFVDDPLGRILDDLKAVWVLVVNGAMAGALLTLYLISPSLAVLAAFPVVALWYMMRRHGRLGQQLRDLRAIHGFAGRIGRSLDLEEVGASAVAEASRILRSDLTMLAVISPDRDTPSRSPPSDSERSASNSAPPNGPASSLRPPVAVTTGPAIAAAGFPGLEICGDAIVALIDDDIGTMGVVIMARSATSTTPFDS